MVNNIIPKYYSTFRWSELGVKESERELERNIPEKVKESLLQDETRELGSVRSQAKHNRVYYVE